jgi:hypothetical protein
MVTAEHARTELGLIQTVRAVDAAALAEAGLSSVAPHGMPVRRASGESVLLLW